MAKKKNHYVDSKEFYEEIKAFRNDPKNIERVERGERPVIPNSIAQKILLICQNLTRKSNFYPYYFKDEMVGDAVENCIRYIWNFDPEKSKNPFAYFTNVAYYAFIRRINREKNNFKKKVKWAKNLMVADSDYQNTIFGEGDVPQNVKDDIYETLQKYHDYDLEEDDKKKKKPKKEQEDPMQEYWEE